MARNYANVLTAIWRLDGDFVKRSAGAQRMYLLLVTQSDISACGVVPFRLPRWISMAPDCTEAGIRRWLTELEEHRYIVVDEVTGELLVRSFTRHDGGYTNPRRQPSIRDAADAIESPRLLKVLSAEFDRLPLPEKWRGRAKSQVNSHSDSQTNGEPHIDGMPNRFQTGCGTEGRGVDTATHNPQPVPPPADPPAEVAVYEPPTNAADVVAAYIDAAITVGQPKPTKGLIGRVGRQAKSLIAEGVPVGDLVEAAQEMGRIGWNDLEIQLQRTAANGRNPPGAAISTRASPNGYRQSTTDQRVAQALALGDQYPD